MAVRRFPCSLLTGDFCSQGSRLLACSPPPSHPIPFSLRLPAYYPPPSSSIATAPVPAAPCRRRRFAAVAVVPRIFRCIDATVAAAAAVPARPPPPPPSNALPVALPVALPAALLLIILSPFALCLTLLAISSPPPPAPTTPATRVAAACKGLLFGSITIIVFSFLVSFSYLFQSPPSRSDALLILVAAAVPPPAIYQPFLRVVSSLFRAETAISH